MTRRFSWDNADRAACVVFVIAAIVFLALSASGRILRQPEEPPAVFVGTAAPLRVSWAHGTPTCDYCGCEVVKANRHCTHCARDFIWTTAPCDKCAGTARGQDPHHRAN